MTVQELIDALEMLPNNYLTIENGDSREFERILLGVDAITGEAVVQLLTGKEK